MTKIRLLLLGILWLPLVSLSTFAGEIGKETKQVVLGLARDWDSSYVNLQFYERSTFNADKWKLVNSWNGRLGKNGLAWGIGFHQLPENAKMKREGDARTPAGIFDISGGAFGFEPDVKRKANLPYHQITPRSLFYEDIKSPYYNSFRLIDHDPKSKEEKAAQMHQNDAAHSLKLFIAHNRQPEPRPGYGSSIFFHIWRQGGKRPTAGCTTMSEKSLRNLIAKIDPKKHPRYVVLPKEVYLKQKDHWKLP